MAGAWTVYCDSCAAPILLQRRGCEWPASDSVIVENRDGQAQVVRCGRCGARWERQDRQPAENLVR